MRFRTPILASAPQVSDMMESRLKCVAFSNDIYNLQLPHWTGRAKWSLNDTRAKYFTRVYQCIEMIDWEEMNGVDTDRNMAPARTLLYMKEGEKPVNASQLHVHGVCCENLCFFSYAYKFQNPEAVTLSASVRFNDSFAVIDRGCFHHTFKST